MKMNFPISHIDFSEITFLLIDDNQFIRKLLVEIILCFGAQKILEAGNVAEALSQVERGSPDIILCDWMMSPADGISFLKNLRSRGIRTPVILVTGHATADYVHDALSEGADSYIVKPFSAATIMEHLLKVIEASDRRETVEL